MTKKESLTYEQMGPNLLNKQIKRLEKKTTVYLIGFGVFFMMAFFYSISISISYFFTILIAFIFMGVLLIYYMIALVFVRLIKILQFNDDLMKDMLNNDDNSKNDGDSIKNREEIPDIT